MAIHFRVMLVATGKFCACAHCREGIPCVHRVRAVIAAWREFEVRERILRAIRRDQERKAT